MNYVIFPLNDVKASIRANLLRNAFIQALMPAIDHEISISSVDNPDLLHQMYQKDTGKKQKKK
jgi:hypothetical protein